MINCFAEGTAESSSDVQYSISNIAIYVAQFKSFITKWNADQRESILKERLTVDNGKTSTYHYVGITCKLLIAAVKFLSTENNCISKPRTRSWFSLFELVELFVSLGRADADSAIHAKALLIGPWPTRASLFVIKASSINFSDIFSLIKMCFTRPPHVFSGNNFCEKMLLHQAVIERPFTFT